MSDNLAPTRASREEIRARIWDTFVEECAQQGHKAMVPEKADAPV